MSDLRNQINSLSAAEEAELPDSVWESLEADSASLTEPQRAELDYRIARHEQNPSDAVTILRTPLIARKTKRPRLIRVVGRMSISPPPSAAQSED
jgi:putative addiction module component (TIGR02574 family)